MLPGFMGNVVMPSYVPQSRVARGITALRLTDTRRGGVVKHKGERPADKPTEASQSYSPSVLGRLGGRSDVYNGELVCIGM